MIHIADHEHLLKSLLLLVLIPSLRSNMHLALALFFLMKRFLHSKFWNLGSLDLTRDTYTIQHKHNNMKILKN